jgi:hypothetical protein
METGGGKYKKVVDLLRDSKPDQGSAYEMEQKILSEILSRRSNSDPAVRLLELFFGWTTVGWVRRVLITASVAMVLLFVFQQGIILREISLLNQRVGETTSGIYSVKAYDTGRLLNIYSLSGQKIQIDRKDLTAKKVKELLKSIDKLRKEYHELNDIIESDPELRSIIEKRLSEINENKIKL